MRSKFLGLILIFLLLSACRLITPFTGGPTLPASLPSTSTATLTATLQTGTPQTATPTITPTATVTDSPTPTVTPTEAPKPIAVLADAPLFSQAFLHTDLGCAWMGVAGQVFNLEGNPLSNLVVSVTGTIGGQTVEGMGYTGAATGYGPGGYEIKLANQALAGTFWIQVLDLEGKALTDPFKFETSGRCEQNLAIVNFGQVYPYQVVLPSITR